MENNNTTDTAQSTVSASVPLSDIFFLTLRHWPWIIASLVVCMGLAYLYILRTPKVYTRSAEILIKEQNKGRTAGMEDFSTMGLFQSKTNIVNEISTMQAKDLMTEVVSRLGLDYNYYRKGTFHNQLLYGPDLPVHAVVAGLGEEDAVQFKLAVKDNKVTISGLSTPDEEYDGNFTGNVGDSIATPVGKVVVTPSVDYEVPEGSTAEAAIDIIVRKVPQSAAQASFSGRLGVTQKEEKGSVLTLTMSDQSTRRADDVLSTLIGVYNEAWIRDKNQVAVSTSNFIKERLGVIESELGNVDSDISSFKSANLVPDVQAASSMYMNENQRTASAILDINNQLQMTRYIRSYLTADNASDRLLPANSGITNPMLAEQINEYNKNVLQRNSLVQKSSEKNPLVQTIDEQLAAQRGAIVQTVDNQIVELQTQLKGLQRSEAQTISRIASNPSQAKYLLSVERQQKVKESLYLFLLQKREDNELSQAFTAYNTRIVNRPGAAGVPVLPNRRNILMIAFLLGLVIPFGVTYVREISNTKVRGRKDLENLSLPFMGEIPLAPDADRSKSPNSDNAIAVHEGHRDVINEAFRVLRTNLEFLRPKDLSGAYVLAMTSFNPHSGKSYISMNLGQSLALKGKRVLVIDGDLRHGSASSYVGSPDRGLADYLNDPSIGLDSVIRDVEGSKNLQLLPVGTLPPNPAELLETQAFADIFKELRKHYDYILIDCPPIEVVADAQIIDQYVDRTVFVIRAGLFERAMLPEIENTFRQKKYRAMALILNGTSTISTSLSHGFRYGYNYGYASHYDYGKPGKKNGK